MLRLLTYLLSKGVVTNKVIPELFGEEVTGLPKVTNNACEATCESCIGSCPTEAIRRLDVSVSVDRGACIACGQCLALCPTGTIINDRTVATHTYTREELILSSQGTSVPAVDNPGIFRKSLALRVVSTGCSACDLEISAAFNPIFDMERFGISVVASPRFADALLVTGPVPKAMHAPLLSCYQAMPGPKLVIACGTCAISGGVHKNSYTEANGVVPLLPVDVFIPGCPPHPWTLIQGVLAAQKLKGQRSLSRRC
ncbi:MAG: NADH-quinone oxidoreductase subunit NuoB [Candidatus Obscuribacterales bacterium]|nr:NADH-quinone oxidoreductase subunit NuoB [Candidatus Obscuribacterales bacterium]